LRTYGRILDPGLLWGRSPWVFAAVTRYRFLDTHLYLDWWLTKNAYGASYFALIHVALEVMTIVSGEVEAVELYGALDRSQGEVKSSR
jgi:hypothetical protein